MSDQLSDQRHVLLVLGDTRAKFLQLYRTGRGADAGAEEDFPKPDNHAKLKRSCDNAEHVGLYLPEPPTASPGNFTPTYGPSTLPPPRNQRAGGNYTRPADTRGAIAFNRALAHLEDGVQHEDNPYLPPSPESLSPISEHSQPMRCRFTFLSEIADILVSGLYAPREGQAYRERQRRQFSQFDRGTPGAESELATLPGQIGSDATPTRHVSALGYGGGAASTFRTPSIAVSPSDYMGPPSFGSQPAQPRNSNMSYDSAVYLARPFQGLRI